MNPEVRDRRQNKRVSITCPMTLFGRGGEVLAKSKTTNISSSGAFVTVPVEVLSSLERSVNVTFSIPRRYGEDTMLEGYAANANVVRHEAMMDDRMAGVGLEFEQPIALGLD